ncbi:MAG: PilW family protein [Dissulfurispiraceae bacterium]|jgi:prepilin-type N-terminal cleavage/methylation domain-containing protein
MGKVFNQKGFTFVELLLAMVIGTIVMGGIYAATLGGHIASTGIEQKISVQEEVRAAIDVMAMEISMASYNPTMTTANIWTSPACGGAGTGTIAYRGIQAATPNSITIEMDTNGNGLIGDPNEIVTYTYDTVNERITRSANCPATPPSFIGDLATASNVQRNVKVINNQLGINVFTYYDSTGTDITANLPAAIPNIRRIEMTLAVVATNPDIQGQTRQMIHSTSVIPRNHAIQFD